MAASSGKRPARFVIVRTNAGYHVRLVASNGQPVQTSEPYTTRRRAARAIEISREAHEAGIPALLVDERQKG